MNQIELAVAWAQEHWAPGLERLQRWMAMPTISNNPDRKDDVRSGAEWLRTELERIGMSACQLIETAGHPIVYAEHGQDPNRPTVVFYGHGDVQPAGDNKWTVTEAFAPVIQGERLYGRGAMDDKGQVWTFLHAVEAIMQSSSALPVNLRIVIENEEEVGSKNFGPFLRSENGMALLAGATVSLVCDTSMHKPEQPCLEWALRGLSYLEVTLTGPKRDLHSGEFGGVVQNPAIVLARMLASLHDDQGLVLVPGFYDDVLSLSDLEQKLVDTDPRTWDDVSRESGVPQVWNPRGLSPGMLIGCQPTLEVNGMGSGYTGPGPMTIIPSKAMAKISCRLVRNQDPDKIGELVAAHLRSLAPPTVTLDCRVLHSGPWVEIDPEAKPMKVAAEALKQSFGVDVAYMRCGGSIPVVDALQRTLHAPAVLMGWGLPDGGIHGPDENFNLTVARKGTEAIIRFLYGL